MKPILNATGDGSIYFDPMLFFYLSLCVWIPCLVLVCLCFEKQVSTCGLCMLRSIRFLAKCVGFLFLAKPKLIPVITDITSKPVCILLDVIIEDCGSLSSGL